MITILASSDDSQKTLWLKEKAEKKKEAVRIDFDADTDTFQDFLYELDAFSLFDEDKWVIVDHCSFLGAKNTSKYDLDTILKHLPVDFDLVFLMSGKLDSRKKAVKTLKSMAKVIELEPLTAKTKPDFVYNQMKKRKLKMDRDAVEYFNTHTGVDPMVLESELEKLSVYSDTIHLEDARALVSLEPVSDIFKMVDALFERNPLRLLALYRSFRSQNMEPMAIIAILSGQVRFLYQIRVLMNQGLSSDEMAQRLQVKPYRALISSRKAARFSSFELLEMLSLLAELDQKMKMGLMDKDLGFEQFVMTMFEKEGNGYGR